VLLLLLLLLPQLEALLLLYSTAQLASSGVAIYC
jgi:hypothetical protein